LHERHRRHALGAPRDHDGVHAGADAARRALHRGHPGRAVAVERYTGDLEQAELDRRVPRDVAAALQHLTHLRVVDVASRNSRSLERLAHHSLGEIEGAHVEQRALAGGADSGASGGNDDGIRHDNSRSRW
jgi:hypothetical protein